MYNNMSLEQKIGQLFMIRAHSDKGQDHVESISQQIKKYKIGGLCFFQGSPEKQIPLVNKFQSEADIPLFVSMDAEWGPAMRFKEDVVNYPRQLLLGAIQDNDLIYNLGQEIGRQLKLIGVNINFAPVVDINNNPLNPVINDRSFGEDKFNVTAKGYMYMKGMQDNGILACAKHFPGHGDTDTDSHKDLPVINHDLARLKNIELYPFTALAKTKLAGVMVAHLNIPALDDRPNIATTLSKPTVTGLLKDSLGFEGLIFTDALEMQGVSKYWPNGEVEFKAFEAGNDILLLPNDLPLAINRIKQAIENNEIPEERLASSVKKILKYKYELNLTKTPAPLEVADIGEKIVTPYAQNLKKDLINASITLVRDQPKLLTLVGGNSYTSIAIGESGNNRFQNTLSKYASINSLRVNNDGDLAKIKSSVKEKDQTYIISLHCKSRYASSQFGLSTEQINWVNKMAKNNKVVLVVFGSPYALKYFDNVNTVICGYNKDDITQEAVANALFGKLPFRGKLPVSASPLSPFNQGITTAAHTILQYGQPETVGINSQFLQKKIDSLVASGIREEAFPGCQIIIAKNNYVIYQKSFGHHTYRKLLPVSQDHIYDLASITKVAATTVAMMKLYELGLVSLDDSIGTYIPMLHNTDKSPLIIRDILAHRAGLQAWIPFYQSTMEKGKIPLTSPVYYRDEANDTFSIQVCDNLYLRNDYPDTIYQKIIDSPLRPGQGYKYSDLGFYLMARLVENVTGQRLDEFVKENIYDPLGLKNTSFQPYKYFPKNDIVPTENDKYYRNTLIQGYVHDMGAAMLDGVSGHAGLFSNVYDMTVLFQMLLNQGSYGGVQIFNPQTVATFTTRHPKSKRRGLGFDMKNLEASSRSLNTAELAGDETFGHLGFTGTAVWADPNYDLVYVFLSNRTYPNYPNRPNLLSLHNYRSKIQNTIYESMDVHQSFPDISQ
ncbi:glycoside hydrolase family 3 N-terminal domain-containing protein [Membranihabitans marinus]